MKTKIGTSFGLALLLALGVLATMLALGTFSASKAEADVNVTAITPVTAVKAGVVTQISIAFRHDRVLVANTGQITVKFDSLYGFPAASGTLPKASITLTTGQTTGGNSSPILDPTYTTDAAGDKTVVITIGDTDGNTTNGNQDMNPQPGGRNGAVGNPHTLVFGTGAGISVPTGTNAAATSWITLSTGTDAAEAADGLANPAGIATTRTIELSSIAGPTGTVVTVTGFGFTNGLSPRVFIDDDGVDNADGGGNFTAGDQDLEVAATPVVAAGTFTRTFTVDTVRFPVGLNSISVDDGAGFVADADSVAWTLRGVVTTDKTTAARGETVQVRLRQWTNGAVTVLTIGGAGINVAALAAVAANTGTYDVVVPTTTPLGTQLVSVTAGGENRTSTIEVGGAPLTLSPATAVPGQNITVSATGFNANRAITMTIGGVAVAAADLNRGTALTTDSSGAISTNVRIAESVITRVAGSTTNLIATDALLRTGQATLTIPSRSITVSPASARRGATVTVTGVGFPAADNVAFTYGAAATPIGSATTDTLGNFTHTFAVPTAAVIPSTNLVTADPALANIANATANHAVPSAIIAITETSAAPGTRATVTGTGFPGYSGMTVLDVGVISAIPTPAPASDVDGNFSVSFLVPQIGVGAQTIRVTVGGTTATSSLNVVAAPVVAPTPVVVAPVATATTFAAVVAQADNLVRVWRYNNATQAWAFYDPRPAFAAANTLTTTSSKDIVWVNIKVQQTFQGQTLFPGWNLISLN